MAWWHNEPDQQQLEYWTIFFWNIPVYSPESSVSIYHKHSSMIVRGMSINLIPSSILIQSGDECFSVTRVHLSHSGRSNENPNSLGSILVFGYCHRLPLSVYVSVCVRVCQPRACMRDNLSPVQATLPYIFIEIHIAFLCGGERRGYLDGWVDYAKYIKSKLPCEPFKVLVFKLQAN